MRIRRLIQKKTKKFFINRLSNKYSLLFESYNKSKKIFCDISNVKIKFSKRTLFANKGDEFLLKVDGQILPKIIESGSFDSFHYSFLKNKLKNNYAFIDVGSNHGFVSWQILKIKKIKKIFAYEPVKQIYELSKYNLKKFRNVIHINAGWSNKNGKKKIYENPNNSGDFSIIKSKQRSKVHLFNFLNVNNEMRKIYRSKKNLKLIIKTDTQGYDINIFNYLDKKFFKDIDIYFLECRSLDQEQRNFFYDRVGLFKKIYVSSPLLFKQAKQIQLKDLDYFFTLKLEFDLILSKI